MNSSDKIWLSRESFETLSYALQNIRIRQDLSILTPRITFSGSGRGAVLFLDIPPSSRGSSGEYNSYFKIVDRSDFIEQDPNASYDEKLYRIAVCDGGTYNAEKGTSSNSLFHLNENTPPSGAAFPYRESPDFKADSGVLFVQIKMVIRLDEGEENGEEEEEGEEEKKFVPEYSVHVSRDNMPETNRYDYMTGLLTCVFTIGRVRFPDYSRKQVSRLQIIQDHLTGPLRLFWYITCGDVWENEEEEE